MASRVLRLSARRTALLPSLAAAARHIRAFCSREGDRSGRRRTLVGLPLKSCSDANETLPATSWGPLTKDSPFPLPGQTGVPLVVQEGGQNSPPFAFLPLPPPDVLTVPLPHERHGDVFSQLKSHLPALIKERARATLHAEDAALEARIMGDETATPKIKSPENLFECAFFDCPSLLKKDLNALFPEADLSQTNFTVVTMCQKTENDMTAWTEAVDAEREELLTSFIDAAQAMAETLKGAGFWADFIDPSSGKPFLSAYTNATLFETDERFRHLGFEIEDLGCCKVIRHHEWGTHAYVGCLFTTAPMRHPVITGIIDHLQNTSAPGCELQTVAAPAPAHVNVEER